MRTTTRVNPDESEEVTRDSHISYSENVNPEEVDIQEVADHILEEVPRHLAPGARVRVVSGDIVVKT